MIPAFPFSMVTTHCKPRASGDDPGILHRVEAREL